MKLEYIHFSIPTGSEGNDLFLGHDTNDKFYPKSGLRTEQCMII